MNKTIKSDLIPELNDIKWKNERRKIKDLKEYDRNPRVLTKTGLEHLTKSITKFNIADPIIINTDGTICGGHGRIKVLKKMGVKEVDVRVPEETLSHEDFAELNIRLNKNIAGEFDMDMLSTDFDYDQLLEYGFEASELGVAVEEVNGLTDPDEVPGEPENPISVLGDIWVLGNHRLMCGDSTSADGVEKLLDGVKPNLMVTDPPYGVEKLLDGVKPNLMVTDPPYGVEYDAGWRNEAERKSGKKIGARAVGKVKNDDKVDWSESYSLFPGNIAYVWHAGVHSPEVAKNLENCGFSMRAQIIWVKSNFAISRGDYHWKHEPCWYAVKNKGDWHGDRKQTTVWEIDKPQKSETGHSTQKPVECMKRPIENNSSPGQAIYEPFSGSGTTIIAAEMTGRSCYAVELNPAYVDMACIRWMNFTGKKAVHAETGEVFGAND